MEKAQFITVDETKLPKSLAAHWAKVREAQAAARKVREAFEAEFVKVAEAKGKGPDDGNQFVFGYRYGRLSFAEVPKTAAKSGADKFTF